MRFFIDLSYCGNQYNGWQSQKKQSNSRCIQQIIEETLFTLTREKHNIVGCGRTDAGVHAKHFMAHVDSSSQLDTKIFIDKCNKLLPLDIVIHHIFESEAASHARFDAVSRSYVYKIHLEKTPFPELSFHYFYKKPDLANLNAAAQILLNYSDFFTFCKTRVDVKTTLCKIESAYWVQIEEDKYEFHITADRFLRGMVRLIVGMCLEVDRGKLTLATVQHSLENKIRLPRQWSVPAIGLFLQQIKYPDSIKKM
ncbi:MAG: tRNA pseudouridine(38-40) synthase TruA [Saprospiraceae bacterium]